MGEDQLNDRQRALAKQLLDELGEEGSEPADESEARLRELLLQALEEEQSEKEAIDAWASDVAAARVKLRSEQHLRLRVDDSDPTGGGGIPVPVPSLQECLDAAYMAYLQNVRTCMFLPFDPQFYDPGRPDDVARCLRIADERYFEQSANCFEGGRGGIGVG